MTTEHPAGTVDVQGTQIDLLVNDNGRWVAHLSGERINEDSRSDLIGELNKRVKAASASVSVPFIMPGYDGQASLGEAVGVHTGNENIIVRWANGKREQLSRYSHDRFYRPDMDMAEWKRLSDARKQADQALKDYENQYVITDLRAEVYTAIQEAITQEK